MSSLSRSIFRLARVSGATAVGRTLRPGAVVLCYHNVVVGSAPAADRALHLRVEAFAEQMAWLARHFTVVALDELHARAARGRSLRGLAAVTFDDAYQGTLAHALPLLTRMAVPATVFVPTAAPARGEPFWWDRASAGAAADPARRTHCVETLAGDAAAILAGAPADPPLPAQCLPASWAQINAASTSLCAFEAHSVTHRNLARLDDAALLAELRDAMQHLAEHTGTTPRWLAYPYGRWDARVAAAAREAGYTGAWTLAGRDVTSNTDWWSAPRVDIPSGITLDAFAAWLSGFAHWRRAPDGSGSPTA